ncbi:MAG: hypothetical protein A2V77_17440 [Anaeromyxobacter sp. RBG_16_69_14]|nr:MAG: hypothetical protein A2V77_17440 [Anaeromyxobacter sp. RBG_16_69_14]
MAKRLTPLTTAGSDTNRPTALATSASEIPTLIVGPPVFVLPESLGHPQAPQPPVDAGGGESHLVSDLLQAEAIHKVHHRHDPGRLGLAAHQAAEAESGHAALLLLLRAGDGTQLLVAGVLRSAPLGPQHVQTGAGGDSQ